MTPEYNILAHFNSAQFRLIRKRIIESILSTDMANHGRYLTALKNKITVNGVNEGENVGLIIDDNDPSVKFDNQQLVLNNLLHCADISNPAKLSKVYRKWVDLVFVEFFNQGDAEKKEGLSVSLLCDRATTDINKAQVGFIKFVVRPTFECLKNIIPELATYIDYINKNLKMYEDEIKKDEDKKKSISV